VATLTARRAWQLIALTTFCVGFVGGVFMWVFDHEDFPTLGSGVWFAIQSITTVGYGDRVPTSAAGRVVATVVIVMGLGFVSVFTATITATFVESARRRRRAPDAITLEHIAQRLDQIEALMDERFKADQRDPDQRDGEGLHE